jgi:uncharacterized RDD family membrane protein YckC
MWMALEDRSVTATPEGVSLDVVLAGLGSRAAAYLIDFLIQIALFVVFLVALHLLLSSGNETSGLIGSGAVSLFAFLDFIGYFVISEMLSSGRSIGKRANGLRVVRSDGGAAGFWASALRNVIRLIDMIPFPSYLVGSVLVLSTTRNQRLGDLAGGTVVIRERTAASAAFAAQPWAAGGQWMSGSGWGVGWTPPATVPAGLEHWDVSAVSAAEVMLIGAFLANRHGYAVDARARLGIQLANQIWPEVAGAPTNLHPEQFLEGVAMAKATRG